MDENENPKRQPLWQTGVAHARRVAATAAADVRETVSHARRLSLEPPAVDRRFRRVTHAFALPFVLLGMTLRDPRNRGPYLKTALPTALVTLVIGIFAVTSPWTRDHFRVEHEKKTRHVPAVAPVVSQVEPTTPSTTDNHEALVVTPPVVTTPRAAADSENDGDGDDDDEADTDEDSDTPPKVALPSSAAQAPAEPKNADEALALVASKLREAKSESEKSRAKANPAEKSRDAKNEAILEKVAAKLEAARERVKKKEAASASTLRSESPRHGRVTAGPIYIDNDDDPETTEGWSWPSLSALYAALVLVEWWTLALSRDYQNQLSRRICLLSGATPEDPEAIPHIRVRPRWFWKKMRRKLRGFILVVSGIVPLLLVTWIPTIGKWAYSLLGGAWSFYWLSVFCLGAAAAGWSIDSPTDPWFIRAMDRAGKIPVIGWFARVYNRLWRRVSGSVRPVCTTFERAPYEGAGLALARVVCGLPMIYGFVRPVFAVAAQLVVRPYVDPPNAERPALRDALIVESQVGSDALGEIG